MTLVSQEARSALRTEARGAAVRGGTAVRGGATAGEYPEIGHAGCEHRGDYLDSRAGPEQAIWQIT